jgi:hypothetical protein
MTRARRRWNSAFCGEQHTEFISERQHPSSFALTSRSTTIPSNPSRPES